MSDHPDWAAATWDGARRARIRRALRLTVRERLQALEDLGETSDALVRSAPAPPGLAKGPAQVSTKVSAESQVSSATST